MTCSACICENWYEVTKFDPRVVGLYSRHYSARAGVSNRTRTEKGILSPGESLTLLTVDGRAAFAWRKGIDDCIPKQTGVNCAFFRNEGDLLSSDLIKEADKFAFAKWPGERHYTYVNDKKIRSTNPGYCFKMAGWRECGKTKGELIILELLP